MPLPEAITDADVARWEANIARHIATSPHRDAVASMSLLDRERYLYTGEWLTEQLAERQCPVDLTRSICRASGALQVLGAVTAQNPWEIARAVLDRYDAGAPITHGPALKQMLLAELARIPFEKGNHREYHSY